LKLKPVEAEICDQGTNRISSQPTGQRGSHFIMKHPMAEEQSFPCILEKNSNKKLLKKTY